MGAAASFLAQAERQDHLLSLLEIAKHYSTELSTSYPFLGPNIDENLPNLIDDHPGFLLALNILLGQKRTASVSALIIQAIAASCSAHLNDVYPMNTLNLDLPADQAKAVIKMFMESHKLNTPSAVNAECDETASLDNLQPYLQNKQFMLSSLNVANSQLSSESLQSCGLKQSECLLQLHVGGNPFESMFDVISNIPNSLIVLDVSFTEGLKFTPGVFLTCPQLLHLCIDGCGISTTIHTTNTSSTESSSALTKECSKSIFFGLVCLVNLSMKENCFDTVDSLRGLEYFALKSEENMNRMTTLRNVCIAENPLCETSAEYKSALSYITTTIPSVHTIDDKGVHAVADSTHHSVDRSSVEFRKQHATDKALRENERGMNVVSAAMEREFTAAIMGEKDNAVVS